VTHLLDARALIWSQDDPSRLGASATRTLQNRANVLVVGIETIWEIGIKTAIGKLKLARPFRDWIDKAIADLGLVVLPIDLDHVQKQNDLPFHHRDPFDRMFAAQSVLSGMPGMPVVSNDVIFDAYGVNRIWD
jgi:PIN domain nuclease of toxin-antitoxin system